MMKLDFRKLHLIAVSDLEDSCSKATGIDQGIKRSECYLNEDLREE
jgi:hypothetical protein